MKKFKQSLIFSTVFVLLFSSIGIFAGGYESPGLGSRAISMGGAFIGVADDWTATYWNPAGLSLLTKRGIGFNIDYVSSKSKDDNSVANPFLATLQTEESKKQGNIFYQLDPTEQLEPTQFDKKEVSLDSYLPGFGIYTPTKIGTLCFSIYNPVGYKMKWNDSILDATSAAVNASYEQSLYLLVINLSLGKEFTPKFSGGIGVNYLQGNHKVSASKSSTQFDLDIEAKKISGVEGVIGLLYNPKEKFSCGLVYRTGAEVEIKGDATAAGLILDPSKGIVTPTSIPEDTSYTQKIKHPQTMGIGLAYRPKNNLTISFDWQRTIWSELKKDIDFEVEGVFLKDKDESYNWKDTNRWRIGTEYLLNQTTALRAGFFLDPLTPQKESLNITNIMSVGKKEITLGMGFKPGETWRADLTYLYSFGKEEESGVDFTYNTHALLLGLGYEF